MKQMLSITRKELKAYFSSPMAALFIGAFLVAVLFSFFWLETFFARNTADVRPLFRWMPILMIFLVGALTMQQWSEEQRSGTMEVLMTLPVRLWQLVMGKFLAVLILVAIALALTFGLPLTVAHLGNLDWGPVFGGYLGALLMASAYIAIGLFVSSRTDNQIVALIMTVLLAGFLYILGSSGVTNFMNNSTAEFFRSLGTGSRFASIERGVIDLRDVFYYVSLTTFFLILNGISLDRKRWSSGANTRGYRRTATTAVVLIALNLLAANIWLNKVNTARLDLTENHEYSLSQTTRDLIGNLPNPLILRGYFSAKTHPLLSPLVPRIKDMMREYGVASNGHVQVSFVDPQYHPKMEAAANREYGIKPVPFEVAGRYESSVINSYFNILVKYGDQHVVLGFDDLIDVRRRGDGRIDVRLNNLEYDLTKSIKKVVYGFQSLGDVFAKVNKPMTLTAIISKGTLPGPLAKMPGNISQAARELVKESDGKLKFVLIDPDREPGRLPALKKRFGIEPMKTVFFANDTFYLYLYLTTGKQVQRIYLTADMGKGEIKKEVAAVLKRSSAGFLKTIGIWTPPPPRQSPQMAMMGQQPRAQYQMIQRTLMANYNIEKIDLGQGRVPADVDILLLIAPQNLTDMERFAIDQYLMKGGAVVALAGNYLLDLSPYSRVLQVKKVKNGLAGLLSSYGIKIGQSLVLDKQNEPFPIPVTRNLGSLKVQEIRMLNYPFFVDVRGSGMDKDSPIVANLPAVTMNWVSPLTIDPAKSKGRKVARLLTSSPDSWLRSSTNIQPDLQRYPQEGFAPGRKMKRELLAVSEQGVFNSYFADRPDPRQVERAKEIKAARSAKGKAAARQQKKVNLPLGPVIKKSSAAARLVVVGSSEFIDDTVLQISRSTSHDRFLNNMGFVQNSVDWAVEDEDLLAIRSRGSQSRLLIPLTRQQEIFWEWLNYAAALLALVLVSLYGGLRRRKEKPMPLDPQQA